MRRVASFVVSVALLPVLAACASPYLGADLGRINRPISTIWVGVDKFVYVPGPPGQNFVFETAHSGRIIAPGLMYTDGGSIPRFAQIFKGFSPWGFGPAYIVHDWIFYAQHCAVDHDITDQARYRDDERFHDVYAAGGYRAISFHDSSLVLAEAIRTITDNGEVAPQDFPATAISSAVDSVFALALWNEPGACARQRVEPLDIAIVWIRYNDGRMPIPETWKLSPQEVAAAKNLRAKARAMVRTIRPNGPTPPLRTPLVAASE